MTLPEWKDRRIERENTYNVLNNKDGTITLIPVTGEIYESGTPLNAINLNKINASLKHIKKKNEYKEKQQTLITNFFNRLLKGENVSIGAYGDSEFYGYDIYSDDKREHSVKDNAGNTYTQTRASKTIFESFQEKMDEVYGEGKVSIVLRAIGGDYVSLALNRWLPKQYPIGTDICIMEYGMNDSKLATCPYKGDTVEFMKYYRELIETELDNGTAIVLMTPFKNKTSDIKVETHEIAVINLAKEYDIPVINSAELMANFPSTWYSDNIHFNGKGYNDIGISLANCFVGGGLINPIVVSENTQLLTRNQVDGIWWNSNNKEIYNLSTGGYPTPNEIKEGKGIACRIGQDGVVYYSFYAEKDLWIAPFIGLNSETSEAEVKLDFGRESVDYTFDNYPFLGNVADHLNKESTTIKYTKDMLKSTAYVNVLALLYDNLPKLRTIKKGWHTLSIKALNGSIGLGGVIFLDLNFFETIRTKYTKFKNNVIVKPDIATDYKDITVHRQDDGKNYSARFGSYKKDSTMGATTYLYDEDTGKILNVLSLQQLLTLTNKTIRIIPDNMIDGLGYTSVRKNYNIPEQVYMQSTGLYLRAGGMGAGMGLFDYNDNNKMIAQFVMLPDCFLANKMDGGAAIPNQVDLGTSYYKFKDIYAVNGVIQTSDRNKKKDIVDTDLGLDFINKLRPVNFKFKDGTSDRIHTGFIAQEVEEILDEDRALLIKEKGKDDDGNIIEGYALRYNELIAPLVKAVQDLSREVEELKGAKGNY